MRFHALATDYDGTMAHHGTVAAETYAALERLKASGRRLIMVTGRELEDLHTVCERVDLFDRVVAENGALIYDPATKAIRTLADPPPEVFTADLRKHKLPSLSIGHVIVATVEPHHTTVLDAIRRHGLELQVIFNKGAVMVLPSGVNKATGLAATLTELGLSPHNTVAVGDAENDHALLDLCGVGVAVGNALPAVKERADLVTSGRHGHGVIELIDRVLADDLAEVAPPAVLLGDESEGGEAITIDPTRGVLICGTSGSGKSTITTGLLERAAEAGYQFAVIDPEGDYGTLEIAVGLGSPERAPLAEEVLDLLNDPSRNAVVNLLGVSVDDRPKYFAELLPRLLELRARTGRPHLLVIDEVHHLLPADVPTDDSLPEALRGVLSITVHPGSVAPVVLAGVDTVLAVGGQPAKTVAEFCEAVGEAKPKVTDVERLPSGDAVVWRRGQKRSWVAHTEPPRTERVRHSRKYAEGNLGPDRSFYFRGEEGKLNLKAGNLVTFLQLADGVDDETWEFHRRQADYSRWFRDCVKDDGLAEEVSAIEAESADDPKATRAAVRAAVEARYTLPADKPSGKID